jgi:NAD(P)-dependent dehydrogenase (short-subunit alcohol dehydrogenase family)
MTPDRPCSARDRLLDATILRSFDRSGYLRHARRFAPSDLDVDLGGRVALVTGANSGLGFETSLALAQRGATVWMLCRDPGRGAAAQAEIRRRSRSKRVHLAQLDVADLDAVRAFAASLDLPRVDVLVHNAGVLPDRRIETRDGHEVTLATHVLGPWLLTATLRPRLLASPDARVVIVSSGGMYTRRLSLVDCEWRQRPYDGVTAYAMTKRMQVVMAGLLAAELPADRVTVSAMHPGWADTPAVRSSLPRFHALMAGRLRSPAEGADTVVWLAASEAARGHSGRFWFDRAPRSEHLLPWTRESAADRAALLEFCRRHAPAPKQRRRAA